MELLYYEKGLLFPDYFQRDKRVSIYFLSAVRESNFLIRRLGRLVKGRGERKAIELLFFFKKKTFYQWLIELLTE